MDDAELKRLAEAAADYGVTPNWEWDGGPAEVWDLDEDGQPDNHIATCWGNRDRYRVAAFIAAANPNTILRLLRERDEARARLASAQHDVEVYRDAVIEARELARDSMPRHDLLRVDLLRIFEGLHSLPALDADQGEGEGG